jgi:hypothetical protein
MIPLPTRHRAGKENQAVGDMATFGSPPSLRTSAAASINSFRVDAITSGTPFTPLPCRDSFLEVATLLGHDRNYASLLLAPLGIVAGALGWPAPVVFVLNFAGLVPLALLISMAVLKLAAEAGPIQGGLLRAAFGNAIELIVY